MNTIQKLLLVVIIFPMLTVHSFASGGIAHKTASATIKGQAGYVLQINGKIVKADIQPVIINNRTMVPARFLFEAMGATVAWNPKSSKMTINWKKNTLELSTNSKTAIVNQSPFRMEVPAQMINGRLFVPLRFVGEQLGMKVQWLPERKLISLDENKADAPAKLTGITHVPAKHSMSVVIQADQIKKYQTMVLHQPERLVVDLPNMITSKKDVVKKNISAPPVTAIRYSQLDDKTIAKAKLDRNTVRVVIDLEKPSGYVVTNRGKELAINIKPLSEKTLSSTYTVSRGEVDRESTGTLQNENEEDKLRGTVAQGEGEELDNGIYAPTTRRIKALKNTEYIQAGDRVALILKHATLTSGDSDLKEGYTAKYSDDNTTFTIQFPNEKASLVPGTIKVNDPYIRTIEIEKNASKTSIIFNAKRPLTYHVFSRDRLDDTAITLLQPAQANQKLVVIDPGHGGFDPGAVKGSLLEKDLALDISKRVKSILESQNINTYMMREDDRFIDLYERAYIANALNATLFLSVHINTFEGSGNGTETLYHPGNNPQNKISSKEFAKLIQDHMISALQTEDRGIVSRPNLVVLRKTNMPAALAEIAFLSHPGDYARLKSESFRQKAAQALSKAVIKALGD